MSGGTGSRPRIVVLSVLYPRTGQTTSGLFVRERMTRVAEHLPLVVVSPAAWFPFQAVIRRFRRHFRPMGPRCEVLDGIEVHAPRWLSVPGMLKCLDGWLLALGAYPTLRRIERAQGLDLLDAHFGYPDGYAAVLLGRWLRVPVTVTLRGNEARRAATPSGRRQLAKVVRRADRIFTVSDSLRRLALELGAREERVQVVPNGVDSRRFRPVDPVAARRAHSLPEGVPLLITVGTLVERKGFHRVIELLPRLRRRFPGLGYVVVGGPGAEGDCEAWLRRLAEERGVAEAVYFLGSIEPAELHRALSAADVFVLATSGEGWANVLLEAMACGLPVITTDVGGNAEAVYAERLGEVVPFGEAEALARALETAVTREWDREAIRRHAEANGWEQRVTVLVRALTEVAAEGRWHGAVTTDA